MDLQMIFLIWIFIFTGLGEFLFGEFQKSLEIQFKAFDMIFLERYFVVVTYSLNQVQVLRVSEELERTELVLELKGKNEYRPVRLLKNSTGIMIVLNVVLRDIKEIPGIKEQLVISDVKEQVVFILINSISWTVQSSSVVGQCLNGNKTAFGAQVYGMSVLITGKSSCSNVAELDVIGRNTVQLDLPMTKFSAFIINDFLYLISDSSQLSLSKYDLYLNQIWSTFITTSQLVELSIHDTFFYILTTTSLFKIDENGKILNNHFFPSKIFTRFLATNTGLYLLSQDPERSLLWLSLEISEKSERIYSNISKFFSISQFNSSTFVFLLESSQNTSSSKTLIAKSIQPFSQSPCHSSCLSCFGPFNSSCFTCKYFQSDSGCGVCHEGCAECFGPLDSNCLSCGSGFIYYEQKCYRNLSCPIGTFQNLLREICQTCDPACETCKGVSFNDCLKCKTGYLINLNSCVKNCPDGKYPDQGICQICDLNCYRCSSGGPNSCLECKSGYLLFESTCLEYCPEKTWKNGTLCLKCIQNCNFCINSSCLTCEERFFNNDGQCSPCSPGCLSCNSSECIQCDEGFFKTSSICSLQCEEGFYSNGSKCLPCEVTCKTCSGPSSSNCLSCPDDSLLFQSTCIDFQSGCPENYFENSGVCVMCTENCVECLDQFSCDFCGKGYFLSGGKCEKCQEGYCNCSSFCERCENGMCFKCFEPLVLYLGECVEQCPAGYFDSENICLCREFCTACEEENCLQCLSGYFLMNKTCFSCPEGCIECSSEIQCKKCSSGLLLSNGTCTKNCPEGSTPEKSSCIKCPENCKKCQDSLCSECFEDFPRNGFYEKKNQSCSSSLTCISGYIYSNHTQKCESSSKSSLLTFLKSIL